MMRFLAYLGLLSATLLWLGILLGFRPGPTRPCCFFLMPELSGS